MIYKHSCYCCVAIFLAFLLAGCKGITPNVPTTSMLTPEPVSVPLAVKATPDVSPYAQCTAFTDEARLFDIPIPIGSKVYNLNGRDEYNKRILSFTSSLSQFDLFAYYRTEMESLGWHETGNFEGIESCLTLQKPTKSCIVTIRPGPGKLQTVTLFIGSRKVIDQG